MTVLKAEDSLSAKYLFTCEHAGYKIPTFVKNKSAFDGKTLRSHRGWDQGALLLAKILQKYLHGTLISFEHTRLCIDANRSLDNGAIRDAEVDYTALEREKLVDLYERYRNMIFRSAHKMSRKNTTLAFSVHSFTPIWKNKVRSTDIGLLFRPWNQREALLAGKIKKSLNRNSDGRYAVHFNKPYRGYTDCLLNDLLDENKKNKNLNGLFLEINQRVLQNKKQIQEVGTLLAQAIKESTES